MAKLIKNNNHYNRVNIPVQTIDELNWTKNTKITIKRVGKKVVIESEE